MNSFKEDDLYSIEELYQKLFLIKEDVHTGLNFPKAFATLLIEIIEIKKRLNDR